MGLRHGTPPTSVSTPKTMKLGVLVTTSLFNLRHKAGGHPIDFFTNGWDLKRRLEVMGEEVSDEVY